MVDREIITIDNIQHSLDVISNGDTALEVKESKILDTNFTVINKYRGTCKHMVIRNDDVYIRMGVR